MLKQICLYCKAYLGSIEQSGDNNERISHGVCPSCFPRLVAGSGKPFLDFLDTLPGPVFVVDQDVRVLAANARGRDLVSKKLEQIQGRLGGEMFSCKYSRMPDGCGQTIHCKTCTIRITVTKAFENGCASVGVPAYMDLVHYTGDKTVKFFISTEKVGKIVFLRIDDAPPVEPAHSKQG